MANSSYSYDWLFVDTRDEQITHVYVALTAHGDSPLGVQGWHHKSFPSRMTVMEILEKEVANAVMWPQAAPPWTFDRERDGS